MRTKIADEEARLRRLEAAYPPDRDVDKLEIIPLFNGAPVPPNTTGRRRIIIRVCHTRTVGCPVPHPPGERPIEEMSSAEILAEIRLLGGDDEL